MSKLKSLVVVTKTAEVPFEALPGFVVTLAAMSREASKKLRENSEITKIDPKLRLPVKEMDEQKFLEGFVTAAIKGWKGLKYKYLPELMLVDLSGVEDLEAEVDFSHEEAVMLLSNSQVFEAWVNDQVFSLDTFRK